MAAEKTEEAQEDGASNKGGSMARMFVIGAIVLVSIAGAAAGVLYFTGALQASGSAETQETANLSDPKAVPLYVPIDPPIVVNVEDGGVLRFLQVNVSIMARKKDVLDDVVNNLPRLRNDLIMLFGNKRYAELKQADAKEALREEALALVQRVVEEVSGSRGIEDVYFTNFVMQ